VSFEDREPDKAGPAIWRWLTQPIAAARRRKLLERDRQARLEESEHRYRTLFESASDAIFIHAPEGPFLEVNGVAKERLGYTRDEFLHMTPMDIDSSEYASLVSERVAELQREGRLVFETEHVRRDGTLVPTEICSRMIEYDGRPAVLSIARDLSERKQAQEALRQRLEELYTLNTLGHRTSGSLSLDQVLEAALEHIVASIAPDLAMLYLRQGEELILKAMQPDIDDIRLAETDPHRVGQCLCGLAADERQPVYSSNMHTDPRCTREECKQAGMQAFAAVPLRSDDDVLAVLGLASATERDFSVQGAFLEALASEIVIGLQNALLFQQVQDRTIELEREVAKREHVEGALRTERDFAESLIETAQTIVLLLDTEGRIVRVNPYAEEISGYRLEEVQGKDWFTTFLPTHNHAEIWGVFQKAVRHIQTRGNVNPIVTKDGQERLIEWYDKTLKDADGNVVGLLAVGQDVTERMQADRALRLYAERLEILREIDQGILTAQSTQAIAQVAVGRIRQLIPCQRATVAAFDPATDETVLLAVDATYETKVKEGTRVSIGSLGKSITALEPGRINIWEVHPSQGGMFERLYAEGMRSYATISLVARGELIGSLNLALTDSAQFTEEHRDIIRQLADQLAIAIQQARLHEQVERHAEELERHVAERTAELSRMVDLMSGREVRMAELKDVIEQLHAQLEAEGLTPVAHDPLAEWRNEP
jgi:PAS domain S-box-containing protein